VRVMVLGEQGFDIVKSEIQDEVLLRQKQSIFDFVDLIIEYSNFLKKRIYVRQRRSLN
jgi:hypothetical protein